MGLWVSGNQGFIGSYLVVFTFFLINFHSNLQLVVGLDLFHVFLSSFPFVLMHKT